MNHARAPTRAGERMCNMRVAFRDERGIEGLYIAVCFMGPIFRRAVFCLEFTRRFYRGLFIMVR